MRLKGESKKRKKRGLFGRGKKDDTEQIYVTRQGEVNADGEAVSSETAEEIADTSPAVVGDSTPEACGATEDIADDETPNGTVPDAADETPFAADEGEASAPPDGGDEEPVGEEAEGSAEPDSSVTADVPAVTGDLDEPSLAAASPGEEDAPPVGEPNTDDGEQEDTSIGEEDSLSASDEIPPTPPVDQQETGDTGDGEQADGSDGDAVPPGEEEPSAPAATDVPEDGDGDDAAPTDEGEEAPTVVPDGFEVADSDPEKAQPSDADDEDEDASTGEEPNEDLSRFSTHNFDEDEATEVTIMSGDAISEVREAIANDTITDLDSVIVLPTKQVNRCECCGRLHDIYGFKAPDTLNMGGIEVTFLAAHYYCDISREIFTSPRQMLGNHKSLCDAYKVERGLVSGSSIADALEKYHMDPLDLDIVLGWEQGTTDSYIAGDVQGETNDEFLCMVIDNPSHLLTLVQEYENLLTPYYHFQDVVATLAGLCGEAPSAPSKEADETAASEEAPALTEPVGDDAASSETPTPSESVEDGEGDEAPTPVAPPPEDESSEVPEDEGRVSVTPMDGEEGGDEGTDDAASATTPTSQSDAPNPEGPPEDEDPFSDEEGDRLPKLDLSDVEGVEGALDSYDENGLKAVRPSAPEEEPPRFDTGDSEPEQTPQDTPLGEDAAGGDDEISDTLLTSSSYSTTEAAAEEEGEDDEEDQPEERRGLFGRRRKPKATKKAKPRRESRKERAARLQAEALAAQADEDEGEEDEEDEDSVTEEEEMEYYDERPKTTVKDMVFLVIELGIGAAVTFVIGAQLGSFYLQNLVQGFLGG